ncbi:hypothetical protein DRO58_01635 [Candidatus Bathyarchaeota archaeon]|nr:MAG: hypothetical protein DRO58_01635 [Candidatus Bathyarchaeota archaeon]
MVTRILIFTAASSTVAMFVIATVYPFYVEPISFEPLDFYRAGSREVSLEELVATVEARNMTLYLPSKLPRGLELTAIYLKDAPFIAILVYSAGGDRDYKTAELTIEIAPSSYPPSSLDQLKSWIGEDEEALEVNGWLARVTRNAYIHDRAFTWKYGTDRVALVEAWVDGFNYLIRSPTLTVDELIQLIRGMKPSENCINFSTFFNIYA